MTTTLTGQLADGVRLAVVAAHQLVRLVDHIGADGRLEDGRQRDGHILAGLVLVGVDTHEGARSRQTLRTGGERKTWG